MWRSRHKLLMVAPMPGGLSIVLRWLTSGLCICAEVPPPVNLLTMKPQIDRANWMIFEVVGISKNRHQNVVEGSQSMYLGTCVKLGKIRGLLNQETELKLQSQTYKLKRVQRRSTDCRNTRITEGTKRKLLRWLGLPQAPRKRKIGIQM